ncbi:signal peptidase II [Mangrovibrevibacter kandeliae]|uniref:signal peptidase II n=1 Tax=Mangrovibrevibacter kandeliae TaxID=2968473 RepID=UPI0021182EA2|nr:MULTISPECIES: signal peptidase II [unclassified Aurantimonas]MCQ8782192.1 signal peptidase II [Aurantimonas sp. CSK15Z-1]MCW4115159.1 signal peptidase II [Aurantimonas sp. MSK8Z-1]
MRLKQVLYNAAIALVAIVADQLVKLLIVRFLAVGEGVELLPFLALYHARNDGIAFSMLAGFGDVGLSIVALLVLGFVAWLWWKTPPERRLTHVGFAVIVGGAIGNLIDRVRLGYVVDYILFHTPVWSFAVFNLADACITVGAGLVLLDEFLLVGRSRRPPPTDARETGD